VNVYGEEIIRNQINEKIDVDENEVDENKID